MTTVILVTIAIITVADAIRVANVVGLWGNKKGKKNDR